MPTWQEKVLGQDSPTRPCEIGLKQSFLKVDFGHAEIFVHFDRTIYGFPFMLTMGRSRYY